MNYFYRKPLNNAPGILIQTNETPFSRSIQRRNKWDVMQLMIQTYNLKLALSNEYLEVLIQCLKTKIFNREVEVLFVFFYFIE